MARIRTIKPQLGRHRDLYDLEIETGLPIRFVWALFPTVCDREGRFIWRPWEIKLDILPYDSVDFDRLMDVLWTFGFLEKYQNGGVIYGCIPTFLKHQVINAREAKSQIPSSSDQNSEVLTRGSRVTDLHVHAHGEGKGREKEGKRKRKGTELHANPRVTTGEPSQGSLALPDQALSALYQDQQPSLSSPPKKAQVFLAKYCELFSTAYKEGHPPITGHDAGIAKRLSQYLSLADIDLFLTAYFQMPDAFLIKAKHPLTVFETRLKEVAVFARSGQFTTQRQASQQDDLASNMMLLQKVRAGGE